MGERVAGGALLDSSTASRAENAPSSASIRPSRSPSRHRPQRRRSANSRPITAAGAEPVPPEPRHAAAMTSWTPSGTPSSSTSVPRPRPSRRRAPFSIRSRITSSTKNGLPSVSVVDRPRRASSAPRARRATRQPATSRSSSPRSGIRRSGRRAEGRRAARRAGGRRRARFRGRSPTISSGTWALARAAGGGEQQGRAVGPVQVVEHEQDRRARDRTQEGGDGVEQHVAPGLGVVRARGRLAQADRSSGMRRPSSTASGPTGVARRGAGEH